MLGLREMVEWNRMIPGFEVLFGGLFGWNVLEPVKMRSHSIHFYSLPS